MKLSSIISISGKAGLSKIISQTRNGLIAESLIDGKRFPVHATQRISAIEDISIYTLEEDLLLSDIFQRIHDKENGQKAPNHKESANVLKDYFLTVVPDYDDERVYHSDLKKIFQWYNLLQEKGLLESEAEEEQNESEAVEDNGKENSEVTSQENKGGSEE